MHANRSLLRCPFCAFLPELHCEPKLPLSLSHKMAKNFTFYLYDFFRLSYFFVTNSVVICVLCARYYCRHAFICSGEFHLTRSTNTHEASINCRKRARQRALGLLFLLLPRVDYFQGDLQTRIFKENKRQKVTVFNSSQPKEAIWNRKNFLSTKSRE